MDVLRIVARGTPNTANVSCLNTSQRNASVYGKFTRSELHAGLPPVESKWKRITFSLLQQSRTL